MRPIRLARIAAEAEGVRLRALVRRIVMRLVFAVVALVFLLGALAFAHVAAWYWLRTDMSLSFYIATGIVGGADLVLAVVLGVLAGQSGPGRVEREALQVRRQAIVGIGSFMSLSQMAFPVLRIAADLRRRRSRA